MDQMKNALIPEGTAKPAQKAPRIYKTTALSRLILAASLALCLLLVNAATWPWGMGNTVTVFAWYALLLPAMGREALLRRRESRVLLAYNLLLAASFALTSNPWFRLWNFLALVLLVPIHTASLAFGDLLPWWRPAMVGERLGLLCRGAFCHLGAAPAAISAGREKKSLSLTVVLGAAAALALVSALLPVLASADALFAAATQGLVEFIRLHFARELWKLFWALALTPFLFGLLYCLRHVPVQTKARTLYTVDSALFAIILGALDVLYLLFLAVQSAGLFGGPEYLAQRGISYADWARNGFFQMVGVTILNLAAVMASLTFSQQESRGWRAVQGLSAALVGESLILLASAAWRMTLYVSAYGLSFKRFMTYWGMVMMALFLLSALEKTRRPDRSFCRRALPLALAGWLAINCIPVDYLVAKNQVDRYLSGESPILSVHYLAYALSYDTFSQLERLDPALPLAICEGDWWSRQHTAGSLVEKRRAAAQEDCADWRSWNLSACLAAGRN
ncbi:DUF4153 domain-containing protein [uncultured Oscillibacter sp.]|jgi:hypothetical protein|uniref:DUF4153 domain-containing protein n=1 Tax=uncultured Oscillibacter sp. TaxID=876091 RepID=UPI0025E95DBF|nr:DUF4173 domain-containing protein [uncultured Oscillibacter sp.]